MHFFMDIKFYNSLFVYPVNAAKIMVLAKNANWILNIGNKNEEIDWNEMNYVRFSESLAKNEFCLLI